MEMVDLGQQWWFSATEARHESFERTCGENHEHLMFLWDAITTA